MKAIRLGMVGMRRRNGIPGRRNSMIRGLDAGKHGCVPKGREVQAAEMGSGR